MNKALALFCAVLLTGCASQGAGSLTGTVTGSRNLHTPEYQVRGRTAYDQRWINQTTEALVVGFGQPRPKARPASFDAPRQAGAPKAKVTPANANSTKRKWFQRPKQAVVS